jgi:hypothetical protein
MGTDGSEWQQPGRRSPPNAVSITYSIGSFDNDKVTRALL